MNDTRPKGRAAVEAHIRETDIGRTPEDMRVNFERLAGPQPPWRLVDVGGEMFKAPTVKSNRIGAPLIFFHGGGYVFGSPDSHMALAARLMWRGVDVLMAEYPLAPEAPWPAQLDRALTLIDAVGGPVRLGGISAGGHLALNAALRRPGQIDALLLISPNTDRTGESRTRQALEEVDLMNDDAEDARLAQMAMGKMALDDPEVSPLLADLSGLPRTRIIVGGHEVLLDDALLLARRAACQGVPVSLDLCEGLFHMAQLWPDAIGEAGASLDRAAAWLSGR